MELKATILCDFAIVRDSLLTVVGGGVTRVFSANAPVNPNLSVAVVLGLSQTEMGASHEARLEVHDEDGNAVSAVIGSFQFTPQPVGTDRLGINVLPGEEMVIPLSFDLRGCSLPHFGGYSIVLVVDGEVMTLRTAFRLIPPPPPT